MERMYTCMMKESKREQEREMERSVAMNGERQEVYRSGGGFNKM